ncbi:Calcium-transporting ATPase 12, plasma membrane-type [Vitis vinifera]|uniref:Calcium-transporting ATPase 12, plasma membrane-type n=1 Tax=Vitis vinifera TaxID=29760 RepID=A0A438DQ61_VITVI|nr:Calcium-transporting ATPase 12, plasma membrane-type [Vitis vinifera]
MGMRNNFISGDGELAKPAKLVQQVFFHSGELLSVQGRKRRSQRARVLGWEPQDLNFCGRARARTEEWQHATRRKGKEENEEENDWSIYRVVQAPTINGNTQEFGAGLPAAQLRPSIDRRDADDHGIYTDVDGDGDGTHIHFDSDGDGTHIDADVDGDGTHVDFDRNGDGAHIDGDGDGDGDVECYGTQVDFDGDGDGTLIDVDGHDVDDNGTHKDVNGVCGTPVDLDGDGTHIDVDNHGTHTDVDGHDTHKDHKQLGRLPRGSTEDGSSLPSRVNAALPSRPWIAAAAILQSALEGTLSQKTGFNGELVEQNKVDDGLAQQTKLDARLAGQITVACRVLDQSTVVRGLAEQTTVDAKACSPRNYKRQPHEVELDEVAIHLSIPSQCAVGNGSYSNDDGVNSVIGQLKSKAAHSLICSFSASSGQVVVDLSNMNTSFKTILVQEEEVQQLQTIAISEILKEEKDWNAQLGRNNLPEDEGQQLWKAVAKIVEKKFLNALRRLGGAEQVLLNLGPLLGARKVAGDGPEFLECTKTPVYEIGSFFLQACKRRTNVILLLLGALVLALGMWEKGTQKGWHDGFGILMALFLILSFTSVSRFRRARQMKKRLIEENGLQVEVIRSGQSHLVPICEIGEDMIVRLRKGSLVPADGLLVGGNSLVLDGILDKVISCDQNPFLYSGSKVIQGDGLMLVTSAGNATELGHGNEFGCLSYWNERSRSSNITLNPKSLSACGTLGIVTVLCIDISGGILTSDRMEVNRFWIGEEDIADDHDDGHSEVSPVVLEALSRGVGAMGLVPGIPLTSADDALICWAKSKRDFKMELLEQRSTAVCDGKLSSNKEGNGVLLRNSDDDENILHLHWKGDAKTILDLCSRYYECGGEIHAIEKQKSKFEKVTKEMEGSGLQPIAFAYKQTEVIELEENGLILLALVVLNSTTVWRRSNQWELGLFSPGSDDDGQTLKGREFRELSDDVRAETADQITLLWSSLPTEKLLMVKSLKQRGHVVAFLGGLTARDAPVLKEADIGITTGNWSTQLAVEISDIDIGKSITSLIPILASGKLAYRSIQKFVHIHVTSNLTILLTTAVESICLGETSITIFHLLYLNLILGIVGGFMLVTKPRNQQLGSIEPGKRNAWIITKAMWGNTLIQVLYQVAVLLMFQFKGEAVPGMKHINQKVKKAVIFFSFILYQVVGATEFWVRLNWVHLAFCSLISLISWVIHLATVFLSLLIKRRAS